jgi:hypothetical protein
MSRKIDVKLDAAGLAVGPPFSVSSASLNPRFTFHTLRHLMGKFHLSFITN